MVGGEDAEAAAAGDDQLPGAVFGVDVVLDVGAAGARLRDDPRGRRPRVDRGEAQAADRVDRALAVRDAGAPDRHAEAFHRVPRVGNVEARDALAAAHVEVVSDDRHARVPVPRRDVGGEDRGRLHRSESHVLRPGLRQSDGRVPLPRLGVRRIRHVDGRESAAAGDVQERLRRVREAVRAALRRRRVDAGRQPPARRRRRDAPAELPRQLRRVRDVEGRQAAAAADDEEDVAADLRRHAWYFCDYVCTTIMTIVSLLVNGLDARTDNLGRRTRSESHVFRPGLRQSDLVRSVGDERHRRVRLVVGLATRVEAADVHDAETAAADDVGVVAARDDEGAALTRPGRRRHAREGLVGRQERLQLKRRESRASRDEHDESPGPLDHLHIAATLRYHGRRCAACCRR